MTMSTTAPKIDYERVLDCVHCGLCLSACPTYQETGHEAASPRGRIYLMRSVLDGKIPLDADVEGHLDTCLNCRACETACPSGVQYGRLIEPFREHMAEHEPGRPLKTLSWPQRLMLKHIFPSRRRSKWALFPARLAQWAGADWLLRKSGLLRLLPKRYREMHNMLPPLKRHYGSLPEVIPAAGPKRARVGLFLGCVADAIYPETNVATAEVLARNGCEVVIPRAQQCCGALHHHIADAETAGRFAAANLAAFDLSSLDAVITNAGGCGAMLKDYGHFDGGGAFAKKVRDVSEFLDELGVIAPGHPLPIRATYHDACHLRHAQGVADPPRRLLSVIPELELVPLEESDLCCGAAGSYNLTQPDMAESLGRRKAEHIAATGATAVFSGNVGCLMQVARHLKTIKPGLWIAHPIDALHAAYTGKLPKGVNA